MSLSDLASLGSFVSGVAVVVTLLFLVLQMRQTERIQQAVLHQGFSTRESELNFKILEPHLLGVYQKALTSNADLTEAEIVELLVMVRGFFLATEDMYFLRKSSLIDEASFQTGLGVFRTFASLPLFRAAWPMVRATFSPEFYAFVLEQFEVIPVREQVDLAAQFQRNLSQLKPTSAT